MLAVVAFDFSMSCPACCLEIGNRKLFHFVQGRKKHEANVVRGDVEISSTLYSRRKEGHGNTERYVSVALAFREFLLSHDIEGGVAAFEEYAFGARGLLAHIGESTGTMKALMASSGFHVASVPLKTVKKVATGSGAANKLKMADAWVRDFGFEMHDLVGCGRGGSPASDLVDAWYVLKTWKKLEEKK